MPGRPWTGSAGVDLARRSLRTLGMRRLVLAVATVSVGALLVRPLIGRHRMTSAPDRFLSAAHAQSVESRHGDDDVRVVERFVHADLVTPRPPLGPARARPARVPRHRSALARLFFGEGAYRPRPFPRPGESQRPTER